MNAKWKVLVVDDEPDFCFMIKTALEKEGFQVDTAANGIEGLEKSKSLRPDAVVLDVMMPGKNGYDVCAELQKDAANEDLVIVMLTAVATHVSSTRYSHYDGISSEADDFIPKGPDCIQSLVDSLKRLLGD